MSILPAGSYALVKINEKEGEGERFMILVVDQDRPGYTWSASGSMTQGQAAEKLGDMGIGAPQQFGLFDAARRHWDAQQNDE